MQSVFGCEQTLGSLDPTLKTMAHHLPQQVLQVAQGAIACVQVTGAFGSSMEVMISVCGETPTIGEVFHCGDAYATVVSVDTSGNPVELPFELAPESPADKLRCAGAADRSGSAHTFLIVGVSDCQLHNSSCALQGRC